MFDVCIIGAGIIGSINSILLSKKGFKVLCIDSNKKPLMSSSACGVGALTPYTDPLFSSKLSDFSSNSVQIHKKVIIPLISTGASSSIDFSESGLLEVFDDNEALKSKINKYQTLPNYNPKILSSDDVLSLEPHLNDDIVGAIMHEEIWVDLDALRSSVRKYISNSSNIEMLTSRKVSSVDLSGSIIKIQTDNGSYNAKNVIYAPGLHGDIVKGLPKYEIAWIRGDGIAVRTKDNKPLFEHVIYRGEGFITPRSDGLTLLGSNYVEDKMNSSDISCKVNSVSVASALEILNSNLHISSQIKNCDIERLWRGWRPKSKDGLPIFGTIENDPRVIVATGFYGLGITMSAAVADTIANYIDNRDNSVFPVVTSPNRFS